MDEEIDIKGELERLNSREPFVAFAIVMTSGSRYEVKEPETIAIGRNVLTHAPRHGSGHSTLRMNQISSIDIVEPS
jgi:hypothetical protein